MKKRFLVMDVDGTLTDGKIYMGAKSQKDWQKIIDEILKK